MIKARVMLILAACFMMVIAASAQPQLTVTPPEGILGTTHRVVGTGLTPDQAYRLDVDFQESGETVFSTSLTADTNGQVLIELLTQEGDAAGVYRINLYSEDDLIASGTMTITAQIQAQASGASIAYNQTVEGAFDQNIIRESYTFDGAQGDIISITMRSTDFDTFITLYGPDSTQLRFNDNAIPPTDSALYSYELPASGRYTIVATSRQAAESGGGSRATGAYRLRLSVARPAQDGEITAGETVVGELSLVAQRAQYHFMGGGGDIVTIDLRSQAFDSVVILLASDDTQIAQDDDGGGGLNARITRFRLPADGEYSIVVDGFRGFTGERRVQGKFTVSLEIEDQAPANPQVTPSQSTPEAATAVAQATPIPATPTPLPALADAGGAIDYGETIAGALTERQQTGRFAFTGSAGDVITITLDSEDFDPKLALAAPDGTTLTTDDDSGPDLNALIREFTLPVDGEYSIIVDGFRGVTGDRSLQGQFALSLNKTGDSTQPSATSAASTPSQALSSGVIVLGQPVSGEFTESAQYAAYTFEGRAGDTVTINLRSNEIDPLLRLIGPDGQVLAEDDDSGGGVQARITAFTLPDDGIYTIEVDAFRGIDSTRLVLGAFELSLKADTATTGEQDATPIAATVTPEAATPATATPEAATPEAVSPTASSPTAAPALTIVPPTPGEAGVIAPGESAQFTFTGAPDEAFSLHFTGAAGDVVGFTVASDGAIDTQMEIATEDGLTVAEDDDSGSGFDPELLGAPLPAYGGYIVTVRPVIEGAAGTVTLSYTTYVETAIGEGGINITLNDKYGPQVLRFNGHGGETVRLVVVSTSQIGGAPEIVVMQDGETLANQMLGRNLRLTFEFITPADGRVDVKVLRDTGAYGELKISIERLVEEASKE